MKTTRYFDEQVLRKRPYLRAEWIEATLADPLRWVEQPDGRVRWWRRVELEDGRVYVLRVVTLADGETVHNAFFDRDAKGGRGVKLHYYPETDSLYIELSAAPSSETRAISETVNVDFGSDGGVVGIDIDHASEQLDLTTLEVSALPLQALRAA